MRVIFLVLERSIFFAAGWDSPPIYRVSANGMFGVRVGQSIHGGDNKQDKSRGNIFSKMENTRGIIQGDNSPGHCFVLRDSIPIKLFK